MKIIEALKQIKDLQKKAEDLRSKIKVFCAHQSIETPTYDDQTKQISEWLQSHSDIIKRIMELRTAVQRTNLAVEVTVMLDGKTVNHTIAEWIHRRRDLANFEESAWRKLTDKNLKEGFMTNSQGEKVEVKIVRCYDPATRDTKVELYRSEPILIDSQLEITNAVTDLIEE